MRHWTPEQVALAAGATLVTLAPSGERRPRRSDDARQGPAGAVIDSRAAGPLQLFVGLPGVRADGGAFAADALSRGAWGVLVAPAHADRAAAAARDADSAAAVLAAADPLLALQTLARAWRRELGARVVAITGSTGKTSTKDILAALLAPRMRTVASRENYNTEIGLPLAVLEAPPGTEALVLELAMRGAGQIAELTAIAEPDVGVIVNVGPVHLELLGSVEAVVAAKAELIAGLAPDSTVVVPAREPLLAPHLRPDLDTITFGDGGDVRLGEPLAPGPAADSAPGRASTTIAIDHAGTRIELEPNFSQAHNLRNLLAAVAAARALGATPSGRLDVTFSALRGERIALPGNIVVINDCYNANPMSMRAALDDLTATAGERRVAVLGDMLELGPDELRFHEQIGTHARAAGVELLIGVGPLGQSIAAAFGDDEPPPPAPPLAERHAVPDADSAAALLAQLLRPGDTVLVKGSRGVGLEVVAEALTARATGASSSGADDRAPSDATAPAGGQR